ncbi:MAG: hypothetical protein HOV76_14015 [Hamadaea sp.]|nr:hypothetical protein [Hamadaea sp.]
MKTPLRRPGLTVALVMALATTVLTAVGPAPAQAADTITCAPQATVFAADTAGRLWRYPLTNPGNVSASWSARSQIGNGWQTYGRVLGGPGGRVYGIKSTGLFRYRWTGSTWEVVNGSPAVNISTSFTQYATASFRDKITVDERGDFFVVDGNGKLRTYRYNEATSTWTFTGRLLDSDWGKYNLIVAAGAGVLYARNATTGSFYRFRYEADSQRWIEYNVLVGTGWQIFTKGIFSVGGDTLFGIKADGTLSQYRFREDTHTWVISGHQAGSGWQGFANVLAVTDTCRLAVSHVPDRPVVSVTRDAPTTITQAASTSIELAYTDNIGHLMHGRMSPDNFSSLQLTPISGNEGFSGRPALSETTANLVRVTARNLSSDIWTLTQSAAGSPGWSAWTDLGGRMASAPAVVRLSNQREVIFAVDAGGALWARWQDPVQADLLAWRKLGGTALAGTPVVVPLADAAAMVFVTDTTGALQAVRYSGGTLQPWTNLGGGSTEPPSVVLLPGYHLRLFSRDATGQVVTTAADSTGAFSGEWTPVGGTATTPAGAPSALLSPVTGRIGVFVRGADGYIHYAPETAQGSGVWGDWIPAQDMFETYATDPTAFGFRNANGANAAYVVRTAAQTVRLYTVQEPMSLTAFGKMHPSASAEQP